MFGKIEQKSFFYVIVKCLNVVRSQGEFARQILLEVLECSRELGRNFLNVFYREKEGFAGKVTLGSIQIFVLRRYFLNELC